MTDKNAQPTKAHGAAPRRVALSRRLLVALHVLLALLAASLVAWGVSRFLV